MTPKIQHMPAPLSDFTTRCVNKFEAHDMWLTTAQEEEKMCKYCTRLL